MKNFKLVTWYSNMVQTMWNDMVQYTFNFHKDYLKVFWSILVFLSSQVHNICFHKYIPLSHFIKWNEIVFFPNILPRLYSNIICKNIVKFFQKFEVGYIQHAHRWKVVQCDTPKVVTIVCFDPIHTIHHDIFWCDVISYSWCWICEGILMNLGFCLGSNCINPPFVG